MDERTIADSARALTLREEGFPPVQYIPRADVDFTLLDATDHETYCPYKGVAHYFSIRMGDVVLDNAVWTYEAPYPAVAEIKGHLAFYTDRVTVAERTVD
ncbi:DUF427 domain-containing protein [Streptomyces sp. 8K308]|uniref:DUF427 domain-containing protein n=1 Tax=Streptomyces sp. 8K308 TaxID=2530388 RepID=UPI001FB69EAA|nr:DUF427 domain-containing protein [Streptomyces sp. 8K308]